MNKIIKTTGIVIAENNVSDEDKMLTILTPEYGKLNILAKKAKNSKSKILPCTQFLSFSHFVLYKGSNTYRVNSSTNIEIFYEIYQDYDKLLTATEISKIVYKVARENENEYNLLKHFINTLKQISFSDKSHDFLVTVFKIRLLKQLGILPEIPDIEEIELEKEERNMILNTDQDKIMILDEEMKINDGIRLHKETIYALKYILSVDLMKIYNFNVSKKILLELKKIENIYFEKYVD